MYSAIEVVVRDVITVGEKSISTLCDVLIYQNGELLDAEKTDWRVLDSLFLESK